MKSLKLLITIEKNEFKDYEPTDNAFGGLEFIVTVQIFTQLLIQIIP